MKITYDMKFDAASIPGKAIVRIKASALHDDGSPFTFKKKIVVKKDGKAEWSYEQAPVFAEAERCVPYASGTDPLEIGKKVGAQVKEELERKIAKYLQAKGLLEGEKGPVISTPVKLDL